MNCINATSEYSYGREKGQCGTTAIGGEYINFLDRQLHVTKNEKGIVKTEIKC